ncbi:MAG: prephenate dehydratase [Bacillota bacterium]|nr:prephenate dehydratase [Bacillota bacterium]
MGKSYRIGYLGPRGTFSEQAARLFLEGRDGESTACDSLEQVLDRVVSGELDEGIVPVENSTEGAVGVTLDLLALHYTLAVRGELVLPVSHCLMAKAGVELAQVERVLSHPQALAQCRGFLQQQLSRALPVECPSTVAAAEQVAGQSRPWAALAPAAAAVEYGLAVLVPEANDYPGSATRFWAVGREPLSSPGAGAKTSIVFSIKDRPGALYHILGEFARRGLNLTRIESRPAKKRLGDYLFFIDFIGSTHIPQVQEALAGVGFRTLFLKVLGSYPCLTPDLTEAP